MTSPYSPPATPIDPRTLPPGEPHHFLSRCWAGEARLWQAFWVLALGVDLLWVAAFYLLGQSGAANGWDLRMLHVPILLCHSAITLGSAVCVWRCSRNCSSRILTWAARIFTLAIAAQMAINFAFKYLV